MLLIYTTGERGAREREKKSRRKEKKKEIRDSAVASRYIPPFPSVPRPREKEGNKENVRGRKREEIIFFV